jgi:hypothetical protein
MLSKVGDNYLYVFKGARNAPRADGATSPRESTTGRGDAMPFGVAGRADAMRPQ